MKKVSILLFGLLALGSLHAQTEVSNTIGVDFAWYPPNHKGYQTTGFAPIDFTTIPAGDLAHADDGRNLGGSGYEGIVKLTHSRKIPFLQGSGPLTSGNNLEVRIAGDLSPISLGGGVTTILTPAAPVSIEASLYAGSGWTVGNLNGLALNTIDDPYNATPFGGLYIKTNLAAALQFDLAAVYPGDWNHVVAVYRPFLEYELNTGAEEDEAWQWQADPGENFNGWNWQQGIFLGYQTPALKRLNTVGILTQTEQRITRFGDSPMVEGGWGSDFLKVYVALIGIMDLKEGHALTIQAQFARERDYTDATVGNESFLNRSVDTDNPTYWYFRRVALSYSLRL